MIYALLELEIDAKRTSKARIRNEALGPCRPEPPKMNVVGIARNAGRILWAGSDAGRSCRGNAVVKADLQVLRPLTCDPLIEMSPNHRFLDVASIDVPDHGQQRPATPTTA